MEGAAQQPKKKKRKRPEKVTAEDLLHTLAQMKAETMQSPALPAGTNKKKQLEKTATTQRMKACIHFFCVFLLC